MSSSDVCSVQSQLDTSTFEFKRLRSLRERVPGTVTDLEFRRVANDYVTLAETCYIELHGDLDTDEKIDDGGLWYRDNSVGEVAEFSTFGTKWGTGSPFSGGQDVGGPEVPGGQVTYSYMANGVSMAGDGNGVNTAIASLPTFASCFYTEIEDAFAAWAAVANITFAQVADDGQAFNTGLVGNIRIGAHPIDGPSAVIAHGYYPPPNGSGAAGDLHFDTAENWNCVDVGPEIDIGIVALHEIGHALGLNHQSLPTVAIMNPNYNAAVELLQPDDIDGIDSIYGSSLASCNIEMSQSSYSGSEIITISTFSVSNPGSEPVAVEMKAWLDLVGFGPYGLINTGADGGYILVGGYSEDFGASPLAPANAAAPGVYAVACRMLNYVTGDVLHETINQFTVSP